MALIWPQGAQARISSLTVTFTSHLEEESGEKEQLDRYVELDSTDLRLNILN